MRGKDKNDDFGVQQIRITPAYAGKSCQRSRHFPACRDHPRLCGEKTYRYVWRLKGTGSPPPMRGKDEMKDNVILKSRITPAYAGKRRNHDSNGNHRRDHPRLCGEKIISPDMYVRFNGITPAYAGKRTDPEQGSGHTEDHPRLCGEKRRFASLWLPVVGSPPPMRGKVHTGSSVFELCGITPAYAGKSFWYAFPVHCI